MALVAGSARLEAVERPAPFPGPGEVVVRVAACGVCRTDLHVVDRELPAVPDGIVPGHEMVGRVEALGAGVDGLSIGQRIGIPWLGHTCGVCRYCATRRSSPATSAICRARLRPCRLLLPAAAGEAEALGLYGFGVAAPIVAQVARAAGWRVHAFTRPGDRAAQAFAREIGAAWAGGSDEPPPESLVTAILFAPVGGLVPAALAATGKGATVACGSIHMSDIPASPIACSGRSGWSGGQPDPRRRRGVPGTGAARAGALRRRDLPAGRGQRGPGPAREGRLTGAAVLVP